MSEAQVEVKPATMDSTHEDVEIMEDSPNFQMSVNDRRGRPTVFTDKVIQDLKSAFLMDCTDQEACLNAGISVEALYKYQERNPDFLQIKRQWKQNPFLKARKTIYDNLNDKQNAQWYLERKARSEFATRRENLNAEVDVNELIDKLDSNYATVAGEAEKQMVALESSVQDKGQTGKPDNVQAEHNTA